MSTIVKIYFFLTIKPWLSNLGSEDVTVRFDEQEKRADFNLFKNQIVVELKYLHDPSTKAATAKTLKGLADFYKTHPNIRVLIMIVFAAHNVSLDSHKWESEFSYTQQDVQVWTCVIRL